VNHPVLTKQRADELLSYCPVSGEIIWKNRASDALKKPELFRAFQKYRVGKPAGYIGGDGYRIIRIDG